MEGTLSVRMRDPLGLIWRSRRCEATLTMVPGMVVDGILEISILDVTVMTLIPR